MNNAVDNEISLKIPAMFVGMSISEFPYTHSASVVSQTEEKALENTAEIKGATLTVTGNGIFPNHNIQPTEQTNTETLNVPMDLGHRRTINYSERVSCCGVRNNDRFFKGCKWSPDEIGNRILTCDGNNKLKIFHCFLNKVDYTMSQISNDTYELYHIGKVYDYDWYPVVDPAQYYVMTASSLGPLHIYDAVTAKSISSYQMYNTNDEAVYAHSVTCSPDGGTILGGTFDYIFLFDVNRPGRTYERILTRSHFKRGIISTIAVNPSKNSLFAVGSYNSRIGIYDETKLLCMFYGHIKGITHLKFSPDGLFLYSGVRGSREIICWDLRNPGTALFKLDRTVRTQQRIYFDITSDSRYVFSGSTDGDIHIWDTTLPPCENVLEPVYKFKAHSDCTNGISVHPRLPFFVTTSGQYHSNKLSELLHDSSNESDNEGDCIAVKQENSLRLWHMDF